MTGIFSFLVTNCAVGYWKVLRSLIMRTRRPFRVCLAGEDAQAATEYALIAVGLLVGLAVVDIFVDRPIWIALLQALQVYFDSFYFLLRLPIP